ncbi:helix-turn-helix transcriptional regulator [Rufibacter quisquiliarum]|uniref:DNA-binding XRE family transcriptional regulator n=1 Tax=Rufibacter quisquiliarum TaxID=1549639 RepID=A0A839GQD0_9BACT|nr:helix-turn-helix transcriptional regulator [Rufibacter quisquiliarum]MBA9077086.1 DNA-binding XRE family transcriptional regulator [Rufibacter quisquiliarum]
MLEEDKEFYALIGENIRRVREEANLKQEAFANMFGLSRASIVNIEKGRQNPSLYFVVKIAVTLNIKIEKILGSTYSVNDNAPDDGLSHSFERKISQLQTDQFRNPETINKLRSFLIENISK